jgi:hypothetical protein
MNSQNLSTKINDNPSTKINDSNKKEDLNISEDKKENEQIIDNKEENEEIDEIPEEEQEDDTDSLNKNKDENSNNQEEGKIEKIFYCLKTSLLWRPIPTIKTTFLCLEITGAIFIFIGIIILVLSNQIKQIEIRYDNNENCQIGSKCDILFNVTEDMHKNVFVYYRLTNFYQNHRRYLKSKSNKQLKGNILTEKEVKDDCDPIILNKDIYEGLKSINKKTLDPDAVAHPCGLIAKSFFNDSYEIKRQEGNEEIKINGNNIAWKVDKKKYKNADDYNELQWLNVEDERFMIWMRPAALPDFRKLWGRIEKDLRKGNYILSITNNYPVKQFDGEKYFILSTVNKLGGKNYFLAILYLVLGGISILAGILFWFAYKKYNTEKNQKTE